jgi:hypothetical protein
MTQIYRYHAEHGARLFDEDEEAPVGWFELPSQAGLTNVGQDEPKFVRAEPQKFRRAGA